MTPSRTSPCTRREKEEASCRAESTVARMLRACPRIFSPSAVRLAPVARAAQERSAHLPLQLADLVAERRLRDVAFRRGAGEAARAGHRVEIAQLVQFHG